MISRTIVFFSVFLFFSALTVSSQDFPPIPDFFSGRITDGGKPISAGTRITVEVTSTGEVVGSAGVFGSDGRYELQVEFCKTSEPACTESNTIDGKATLGAKASWKINGVNAAYPAPGQIQLSSAGGDFNGDMNIEMSSSTAPPASTSSSTTVKTTSQLSSQGTSTTLPPVTVKEPPSATTVPSALSNLLSFRRGASAANASSVEARPGSCFDGVRNGGEEGVDCGGPCQPCKKKDNTVWYVLGGVVVLALFLVFALFLLFLVYSLAKKKRK